MFETETMAELCLKQGLVVDAIAIYRRLLAGSPDEATRARHAQRIAELEARARARHDAPPRADEPAVILTRASAPSITPETTLAADIQARRDERQVTFEWRLPAGTLAPALQILVLRREASGIATEQRTVRLPDAQGTLTLAIAGIHTLRAAAGKLDGERFVPLARLDPDRPPERS